MNVSCPGNCHLGKFQNNRIVTRRHCSDRVGPDCTSHIHSSFRIRRQPYVHVFHRLIKVISTLGHIFFRRGSNASVSAMLCVVSATSNLGTNASLSLRPRPVLPRDRSSKASSPDNGTVLCMGFTLPVIRILIASGANLRITSM